MAQQGESDNETRRAAPSRLWLWALLGILALSGGQIVRSWGRAAPWPGQAVDAAEFDDIASRLLASGRFETVPHGIPGGRYAMRDIGYPAFLAGVYWAAGRLGVERGALARGVQVALTLGMVLMIYLLGARSGRKAAGLIGAFLFAVYPPASDAAMFGLRETLVAFLITAGGLALVAGFQGGRARAFGAGGAVLGAATLVRSATMPLPLLLAVVMGFGLGWRRARTWALAVTFALVFLAVVTPWAVRNWMIFGRPVPLCCGGGLNLFVGNYLPFKGMTRAGSYEMVARICGDAPDEMAADARVTRAALRTIAGYLRHEPIAYSRLLVAKARRFWEYWDVGGTQVTSRFHAASGALHPALLLLGIVGVGAALLGMRFYAPVVLLVVYVWGMHIAVLCEGGRFNLHVMPLVAALAGIGVGFLAGGGGARSGEVLAHDRRQASCEDDEEAGRHGNGNPPDRPRP